MLFFDNIPYTRDDTHIAFAFDILSDVDLNIDRNTVPYEDDPNVPTYQDNGETSISFNDSRRIRFRRIVFCEGGNTLIIKERIFKFTLNGITIRRVFISYIFTKRRCAKLLFDPALENAPPDVVVPFPSQSQSLGSSDHGSDSHQHGSSNVGPSNNKGSNSASFVCFSALLVILSLLF